ncbi:MAG TPA: helix-turn-helix domain-containing protein [Candidatus Acidoferrales bacterium]|nr:helix-turn-helix domain-containing protein [Candidatus Acidoferrales bacterium]
MRRLIVELSVQDFNKLIPEDPIQDVKSMEVLHFLKFDHQEVAMILRVEFNDPDVSIEELFGDDLTEVQLLEREIENGICTYFIKAKPPQAIRGGFDLKAIGGYFSSPYEIKDGNVKITLLGSAKQIRGPLKLLEAADIHYRVVSLTDAKFSPHAPLSSLTEKQRRALITAYKLGYYDIPKKIGLVQLAERLDLSHSTLDMHLRKAERRLLSHTINE